MNQPQSGRDAQIQNDQSAPGLLKQLAALDWRQLTLKQLRGILLLIVGYLLSPLCWWNDLVFNLPVACGFGYVCSLVISDWLLPGALVGYWLSNLVGVVLMQFGVVDMAQTQARSFRKELLAGVATSTVYTLLILGLVQLKILDLATLLPDFSSVHSSLMQP